MDVSNFPFGGLRCMKKQAHRRRHHVAILLMLASLGVLTAQPAWSVGRTTRLLAVSATVQPYAQLASSPPAQLVLSKDDLKLGYVDVPGISNPARLSLAVTTNDRAGYALQFGIAAALQPMLASVQVTGIGPAFSIAPTGGKTVLAYTANKVTFTPAVRFV
jgi:hypothetical protein